MSFDSEIQKCLEVLRSGGIILYPTDTIWGIGCDAANEKAVEKIFSIKQRNESKSLIVLMSDDGMMNRYIKNIPALAWDLMDISDTPLTIIYDRGRNMAKNVFAEDGSIGVRKTNDAFCQRLIHKFRRPIVSTSANISNETSPKNFYEVPEEIKQSVDYVVNWKQDETGYGTPSSIIKLKENGEIKIIRK